MSEPEHLEAAAAWRVRRENGLDHAESEAFARWLAEPQHKDAYERIGRGWAAFDVADSLPVEHLRRQTRNRLRRRRQVVMISRLAAAVVLTAGLGVGFLAFRGDVYDNQGTAPQHVSLPDGSRLTLDADSKVTVRYSGERRDFDLKKGQANFEVAHDPKRPFEVKVGDARVTALGTAFNINRWGRGSTVVLLEGAVRVDTAGRSSGVILSPGQQVTVQDATLSAVSSGQAQTVGAWRTGTLVFNDQSLEQALASVNRYGGPDVKLSDASLGQLRISGVFRAGDTEAFTQGVTAVHGLAASVEPKRIVLHPRR